MIRIEPITARGAITMRQGRAGGAFGYCHGRTREMNERKHEMPAREENLLRTKLKDENYSKLMDIENSKLHQFISEAVELCNPESVFVCTDAPEDIAYIRKQAIESGEEIPLAIEGHTVHFDGYNDQGRDPANTKYLVARGVNLGADLKTMDKEQGLAEIRTYLKNIMAGRQMYVRFFCLGPVQSQFSISGVQVTDSAYVAHSEDLLYRPGYEQFKRLGDSGEFFRVLHSSGELENNVSVNIDKRRVYIDLDEEIVYSVNTQYGGNTIGFKKLALRLAIRKADREGWLAEHMFILGVQGPGGRKTYFTGGFPSYCGKTSTAMLPGETIVGDDIAYLRAIDGEARAVNVECGIFGIIQDVNAQDDPVIYDVVTKPGEVIFSNVLVKDKRPYWLGMGCELPTEGINHSGSWYAGKRDADGKEIPPLHKNARYTVALKDLSNRDERLDDPDGVPVSAIIYGGRDSDTWVPVQEAFDWQHGVITMGASLESETTAATLGQEGVRVFNPMSNIDFVSIPLGKYILNHLNFGKSLARPPAIFSVNYFLKDKTGHYLNGMADKRVWVKWMELRVRGEVDVIAIPTGQIPIYDDLGRLFGELLEKAYTREQYVEQFTTRVPENLGKIERVREAYRTKVPDTPQVVFDVLDEQRSRLLEARKKHGDYVSPFDIGK